MRTILPLLEYEGDGEYTCTGKVQAKILNRRKSWDGDREVIKTRIDIKEKQMTKALREGIDATAHSHSSYLESIKSANKKGEWIITIISYPESHYGG